MALPYETKLLTVVVSHSYFISIKLVSSIFHKYSVMLLSNLICKNN
jgi:hypothetical protein